MRFLSPFWDGVWLALFSVGITLISAQAAESTSEVRAYEIPYGVDMGEAFERSHETCPPAVDGKEAKPSENEVRFAGIFEELPACDLSTDLEARGIRFGPGDFAIGSYFKQVLIVRAQPAELQRIAGLLQTWAEDTATPPAVSFRGEITVEPGSGDPSAQRIYRRFEAGLKEKAEVWAMPAGWREADASEDKAIEFDALPQTDASDERLYFRCAISGRQDDKTEAVDCDMELMVLYNGEKFSLSTHTQLPPGRTERIVLGKTADGATVMASVTPQLRTFPANVDYKRKSRKDTDQLTRRAKKALTGTMDNAERVKAAQARQISTEKAREATNITVNPFFSGALVRIGSDGRAAPMPEVANPFSKVLPGKLYDAKEIFEGAGVNLGRFKMIAYHPGRNLLVAWGPQRELDLIDVFATPLICDPGIGGVISGRLEYVSGEERKTSPFFPGAVWQAPMVIYWGECRVENGAFSGIFHPFPGPGEDAGTSSEITVTYDGVEYHAHSHDHGQGRFVDILVGTTPEDGEIRTRINVEWESDPSPDYWEESSDIAEELRKEAGLR